MAAVTRLIPGRTVLFVCDIQTRFRTFVHGFDHVVATGTKMFKLAKVLDLPVIVTEQNPRALGSTVPELNTAPLGDLFLGAYEKTVFSMAIPPVIEQLKKHDFKSVILFGIESHVCVLQSALDLLEQGYDVHVLADGVSSTRKEEVPIAIERMRRAGAQITTSESAAFELQVDANKPNFKFFSRIIKEEGDNTTKALEGLVTSYSKL
ncbi:Isochorismatase hydrolase [Lentinus tigrinus ALCF2SS1-7]|uniref:Isochorismatase hydrolase n=1 Tax=Lentinus tigrinus ALCF2SS1-6 TaxID=1328759 RepID=A0A5C2SEC0_9APHY|nr:Isochorismatase hydrolase [Lentinus tigrinus ALCF2SS1-6]RPD74516.1 Isochorismatase hydrolase [Lentinus tigrinus ALCF2SS1-7]